MTYVKYRYSWRNQYFFVSCDTTDLAKSLLSSFMNKSEIVFAEVLPEGYVPTTADLKETVTVGFIPFRT